MGHDKQMQTIEEKVDMSKALDASLVDIESGQHHTEQPEFINEGEVDQNAEQEAKEKTQERGRNSRPSVMSYAKSQSTANGSKPNLRSNTQTSRNWPASKNSFEMTKTKPTGKIFKTIGLRWVPTGKIFTSSTTKVDSEPTNGSDEDITNQYEYEQTLDVSAGTLMSGTSCVNKSSSPIDNSTQQDTPPLATAQSTTELITPTTTISAEDNIACTSEIAEDFDSLSFHHVQFKRTSLTGFPAQSIRSSNVVTLDSPYLLVLITGTSQRRQHESRKSPTKSLFDVGSRRISIITVNTKEYHSDVLAIITRIMRNGYSLKDKNEAKIDKTELENG
ncbi:hypothetical protein Tco_0588167 [Tanacetum coccineum]